MTGLQRTTLSDVSNGSVYQRKFGIGAWRIMGGNPTVVGKLVSLGYVKWQPAVEDRADCVLTDAGRAALEADA